MQARELMTENPSCCTPDDTVQHAAKLMAEHDCGCIPVVEDQQSKRIIGTITDRDIACRCMAEARGADTPVGDVMSANPSCCSADDDVRDVERIMADRQVRRVPVVDGSGCCIGIIAQADLARAEDRGVSESEVGRVVERVSEPSRRRRSTEASRPEAR